MKKKNDYWLKREQKWIKERQQSDAKYVKQMAQQYKALQDNLERQIKQFYATYASDTGMSMKDAVKAVKSFDVKSFEKTAKKMVEQKDFSPYANDRLKIYNATMKINRLEYLKSQVGQELIEFTNEQEQQFYGNLKQSYLDELDRQSGILGRHANVQVKQSMDTIVNASFHGAVWSQRLWVAQDELKAKLDTLLTRSMIRGINPKQLVQYVRSNISKEIKNSTAVAKRLMITETARVQDQLQTELFKKNNVEYVKWVAEPTACDICLEIAAENDGVYSIDKAPEVPQHPRCKCSKSAWFGEVKNKTAEFKSDNMREVFGDENYNAFLDKINSPDFDPTIKSIFTKYQDRFKFKFDPIHVCYSPADGMVHLSSETFAGDSGRKPFEIVFHEMAHAIDQYAIKDVLGESTVKTGRKVKIKMGRHSFKDDEWTNKISSSKKYNFSKFIVDDLKNTVFKDDKILNELKEKVKESASIKANYSSLSDILGSTNVYGEGPLGFGHGKRYWKKGTGMQETEFFAEMTEAVAVNPEMLEIQKKYFPTAYKKYFELIKDIEKGG